MIMATTADVLIQSVKRHRRLVKQFNDCLAANPEDSCAELLEAARDVLADEARTLEEGTDILDCPFLD
jgi:hypothetical protein